MDRNDGLAAQEPEDTEETEAVVPADTDLIPDYLTPTIILVGVNIILPTMDLYRDITMMSMLFATEYSEYSWGILFLFIGLLINFIFTSLAWWRLESPTDKSWSWILLLLQVWPQSRAVRVIWLIWTGDPKASEEKARLDREVGGLEPFLEAMPTAFAANYLAFYRYSNRELWLVVGGWNSYYAGINSLSLASSLFLKGGPCSIISSRGPLAGMLTPNFLVLMFSILFTVMSKIVTMHYSPQMFVTYTVCICTFSLLLSLTALRRTLGTWKTTWQIGTTYPALVLLPMFTYFTFGGYRVEGGEVGLILSWKWTFANMIISVFATSIKAGLHLPIYKRTVQCLGIVNPKFLYNAQYLGHFFAFVIFSICTSVLTTMPEFWKAERQLIFEIRLEANSTQAESVMYIYDVILL